MKCSDDDKVVAAAAIFEHTQKQINESDCKYNLDVFDNKIQLGYMYNMHKYKVLIRKFTFSSPFQKKNIAYTNRSSHLFFPLVKPYRPRRPTRREFVAVKRPVRSFPV